jgi:threonine/homoserine/homoserine lactone efflux protein
VAPGRPLAAQFAVLELTFVALAAANAALWAVLTGQVRARFRSRSVLIAASALTAAARRAG